ncbi:transporter [Streptomyces sp. N2-109]|uniref:Transporter n=1 Tax=Streptomyces gossypii TaxID=2883101 RepID=A0ABT2JQ20_9ACTN|nr:SulP family inorganic anion transporter [Streptomyces gossypii]MCT2589906.1 transporter [Streptomyces gossypii]
MSARTPARPATRIPVHGADLSASISVFLIALPLSLGIALTAGAPLQAGLIAAAVGGIIGGRLGGSPLQIGGPAAGLTVVTADLIHLYGWRTTCAITIGAGLLQLCLGFLRVARSALAVSPAIVHGMLAGIGVTIALAQLHIVLGSSPESSAVANVVALPGQLADPHTGALAVSAVTIAVLLSWPHLRRRCGERETAGRSPALSATPGDRTCPRRLTRITAAVTRVIPAALVSVGLATAVAAIGGFQIAHVDLPSWRSHALPEAPSGPVLGLLAAVLTVTLVSGVATLLSAVAVDKMVAARESGAGHTEDRIPRSDLDRELRGLGISNMVSGGLGGLSIAGVAVRSSANVAAGAVSRNSAILHGVWVVLAAGLLVSVLELIPLAALAALVMVVGIQMVSLTHIRTVTRHRESVVHAATTAGVVLLGVLEGVAVGVAFAVVLALHRLTRTRITTDVVEGVHRVRVGGQLTFLAVPRLSRALGQVPEGVSAAVELDGSFMDHAAFETLQEWAAAHEARGGSVEVAGRAGARIAEPAADHSCSPWTPWRNHQCTRPSGASSGHTHRGQLLSGVSNFQRTTAPRVRDELARLAREGQRPSQLFLTCTDSRLVTSMITSSGPGDLCTVRNIGNFVPLPGGGLTGEPTADDSVAAAIEYAVDVLEVESITVCGHSDCNAIQALYAAESVIAPGLSGSSDPSDATCPPATPLVRWLRHGGPSMRRLAAQGGAAPRLASRESEGTELLCLTNVVQQLEHLRAHECVARRLAEGRLELHGMYFHVGEAQTYVMDRTDPAGRAESGREGIRRGPQPAVFTPVRPEAGSPVPRIPWASRADHRAWEHR